MYFDRSYTHKGVETGVMLIPPEGDILKNDIQLDFPATNNIVEYEGLITSLRLAKELDIW
jgi:ribonuclease HI